VNTSTDRRSGNDRRNTERNVSFPLRDSQGITVAVDRRASCDRRTDGLELTEVNISQKVFKAAFKKFQKLERTIVQRRCIKSLCAISLLCLASQSYSAESEGTIPRIIAAPAEPLEVVLLCPEGSQHEGELVPKWVANEEAMEFFCNDAEEETEVGE